MILDEICAHKRGEVDDAKARRPGSQVIEAAEAAGPTRDFRRALREPGISLIAEIKRASPSKGVLLEDLNPIDLASVYESSGARALSILTDEHFFQGTLRDLVTVRKAVNVPCLRKEFIIDEYQIYEARAAGADAILLIVRILSDEQLRDYLQLARSLTMAVLVEAHCEDEVERALKADAAIIGVNNRDLATFETNIDTTMRLKKMVPGGKVLVSESGIHTRDHVKLLDDCGIDAILVGESLVTSNDIAAKIGELLGAGER